MELRHLRYFVAVAEARSFTKAAASLRMAQPPLSLQIRTLEDEVGSRLFDRSPRGVSLTETGRLFLTEARATLVAAQRASDVVNMPSGKHSELRLGVITPATTAKFAEKLGSFQQAHPEVPLRVRHDTVANLHLMLKSGDIDVAITRPFHAEPMLMQQHLEWHDQLLAVPLAHPWAKLKKVPWKKIQGARVLLIAPEFNSLYGQNFLHMCGRHKVTPEISYAASDLHSMIWLVSAGLGVCPYSSSLVSQAHAGVVFKSFSPSCRQIELVLMWPVGKQCPVLKAFIEICSDKSSGETVPKQTDQQ